MNDWDDRIDDAMSGEEPDWESDPVPPQDTAKADQYLWAIGRLLAERADIEARFDARIDQMQLLRHDAVRKVQDRIDWYGGACTDFHRAVLRDDSKRKTIVMPAGLTLKARAQSDEWTFDDKTFCAWADRYLPDAVRRRDPEPDKAAAKKLLKGATVVDGRLILEGGETVPGITVEHRDPAHWIAADDQKVWPLP